MTTSAGLSALPEKFKSIIVLRDIEDMPYEEIARFWRSPSVLCGPGRNGQALLFDWLKEYRGRYAVATGLSGRSGNGVVSTASRFASRPPPLPRSCAAVFVDPDFSPLAA
jgi:hypothetical protein